MTLRPVEVVAGWTGFNLVLASIMFAFGENVLFIGLYFVASVPVLVLAVAVGFADSRRPGRPAELLLGQRAGLTFPIAIGCLLLGLGLVYLTWVAIVGGLLAVGSAVVLLSRPAAAKADGGDDVLPYPLHPRQDLDESEPELTRTGKLALAGAAAAAWLVLTRRARRRG